MQDCHAPSNGLASGPAQARLVALIGPPNSGKTTLFNRLTGLRQKVANYPGVTVEKHLGHVRLDGNRTVGVVDLPGAYSLAPDSGGSTSDDERVTRDVLAGRMPGMPRPDAVLLIIDATNLARNLTLAAPVLSLGLPLLVVLNMADDLRRRGGSVDTQALSVQLGCQVVLASATQGEGLEAILKFLGAGPPAPKPVSLPVLQSIPKCRQWAAGVTRCASYQPPAPPAWTRRLDRIFLHPVAGPAVFGLVVVAVFQVIFSGAAPIMDGVEAFFADSGNWVAARMPDSIWRSLLIEGVWSGTGSVVVFLPQILLLFLFIGVLEDSGYLARAALIADRTMAKAGLQGKSFIPLLSAYACAVPAIMATRTIESRRDRMATILIAPFMTCSARLPIYALIIAAFLPDRPLLGPLLGTQAAAMLGLYALGFAMAVLTAKVLRSSVLKSERGTFVMEMPPYRWPTWRGLGLRLLDRARVFLRRAGIVILPVAVVLWALAHLPLDNGKPPAIENSIAGAIGHAIEPAIAPLGFNWKIGIGLLTSLASREVIVGTLGAIYGIEAEAETVRLQEALQRDLTPGGAFGLLIFFAFAMQCMSTVAVVRRETGGWTWPVVQFAYMTTVAYAGAWAANRLF